MATQQSNRIKIICNRCGEVRHAKPCEVRGPKRGKYCSRACYVAARIRPAEDRFWERVEKTDTCWVWKRGFTSKGYGVFGAGAPCKSMLAHRFSYILHYGAIPVDFPFICHHCDNPPCVRPDHLYAGTNADNMRDMVERGRSYKPKGIKHPHAKLTEADVVEIRRLHSGGMTKAALSRKYAMRDSHIGEIISRRRWSHVE